MAWLREGKSVAYCSDAGTPLVADPGYRLAEAAVAEGLGLTAIPGASAVLTALSLAGLPTDRFLFAGFLPPKQGARKKVLSELATVPATLIFYESPRRLAAALADMTDILGGARAAAVARELTKKFEQVRRGQLGELAGQYAAEDPPRGEVVVLVGPPDPAVAQARSTASLDGELTAALAGLSVKDAAREVAAKLGLPRRDVYARALELAKL
jgi:16S rRNA (cytidine1402-2'-O)-methyltransferase